jgi:glucosamine-6-phosphate deaminase
VRVVRHADAAALGRAAAEEAAEILRAELAARGAATIVVATGASQFATLDHLVAAPGLDWARVTAFHLDEYAGLDAAHPASFRRYLAERFVARVPHLREFVPVMGDAPDLGAEIDRLNARLGETRVCLCLAGIGENGHLAFNDPPADFEAPGAYHVVELDEACRRQQLGEGWFPTLEAVPARAISMTIGRMMACERLVLSVPDARKAEAVRGTVEGPVTPDVPASIVQRHGATTLHLDPASASRLKA